MDPEVRKYFIKILNSFSYGLLWMLAIATAGLYFKLAIIQAGWHWYNVVFYFALAGSLFLLLRYYYKTWKGFKLDLD